MLAQTINNFQACDPQIDICPTIILEPDTAPVYSDDDKQSHDDMKEWNGGIWVQWAYGAAI